MKLRIVQKIRFSLHESGWTKAWCPGLVSRPSAKAQEPVARSRGLVIQHQKLSVGAYFELSFLGCGFLIHLFNRSDIPRFRAPWKKIRQKYWTQQETSLFKGHPLSCQWQEVEGLLFNPKNSQLVHILSFHSQGVVSLFIFPTGPTALDFEPRGRRYVKNMGHNMNRLYSRNIHCPATMEMHYVQWFLLKSVYEIMDCAKNQIFPS